MEKPTPDGYVVVHYMSPVYDHTANRQVMQPTNERFNFSEGWTRKE
jgi:hypothetical protein